MKSKSLLLMMLLALFSSSGAWAQSAYHGYTATAGTSGQSGEGYSNLFDNSTSTKWCVVHSNNTFNGAYVEFYSADCIIPSKYVLTTANDNASNSGRNPKTWTIKAKANSGDEWTTIASETNNTSMQNVNYTPYTFNCNNSGNRAYKYFRFEISAIQSGGVMQLSELHFIATTGDCSSGGGSDDGLTVADATGTNSEIPVYGTWVDAYQHTQTIYPSSMLTDMQGG